jgi:hypothetical protein
LFGTGTVKKRAQDKSQPGSVFTTVGNFRSACTFICQFIHHVEDVVCNPSFGRDKEKREIKTPLSELK